MPCLVPVLGHLWIRFCHFNIKVSLAPVNEGDVDHKEVDKENDGLNNEVKTVHDCYDHRRTDPSLMISKATVKLTKV